MANVLDMSFNVGITISDETVQRCCQLLSIYLTDNPDMEIAMTSGKEVWNNGEYSASVYIKDKPKREEN